MLIYDTCRTVYGDKSQHHLQLTHGKIKYWRIFLVYSKHSIIARLVSSKCVLSGNLATGKSWESPLGQTGINKLLTRHTVNELFSSFSSLIDVKYTGKIQTFQLVELLWMRTATFGKQITLNLRLLTTNTMKKWMVSQPLTLKHSTVQACLQSLGIAFSVRIPEL